MGAKRILVVDDHVDILEMLTVQLRCFDWDVTPARSGRDALEKLKEFRPSLILVDMWMPEMDGFELVRLVKQDAEYRDIPILAITAMGMPEGRELCLQAGCDDCILKPFRFRELRERLTDLLCKSDLAAVKCL